MGLMLLEVYTAWWLTYPSEKYDFVSWDDDIPNIWKNKSRVPNHQPVYHEITCLPVCLRVIQPRPNQRGPTSQTLSILIPVMGHNYPHSTRRYKIHRW